MSPSAPESAGPDARAAAARAVRLERALAAASLELDATVDALRRLTTVVRRVAREDAEAGAEGRADHATPSPATSGPEPTHTAPTPGRTAVAVAAPARAEATAAVPAPALDELTVVVPVLPPIVPVADVLPIVARIPVVAPPVAATDRSPVVAA